MIIFLPSYKRTSLLPYVIESILNTDTSGINERLLIVLHNNYLPARPEVDSIVKSYSGCSQFEFVVVHREQTMIPIDAWFDTILATAYENETIFILGDDDLITPWGIRDRYHEINLHKADLLLSNFAQRLYFFEGGRLCWPDMPALTRPANMRAEVWKFSTAKHGITTFISNHCYRNTEAFRNGLKCAFQWCSLQQDWAPRVFTTGLLPSYLPYAVEMCGGKVVELPQFSVIRGSLFEEAISQDYSDGGTTSFYALLSLNMFSNRAIFSNIDQFKGLRQIFAKSFRIGLLDSLTSKNIKLKMIMGGIKATGLKRRDVLKIEVLNLRTIARLFPFFRGLTLKRQAKNENILIPTRQLLEELKSK